MPGPVGGLGGQEVVGMKRMVVGVLVVALLRIVVGTTAGAASGPDDGAIQGPQGAVRLRRRRRRVNRRTKAGGVLMASPSLVGCPA